jgi:hypothetical protein
MELQIKRLNEAIAPLREKIINHEVYQAIENIEDLNVFMEHHVFAVWDFMSLLKSLQNFLTCTDVPWMPKGDAQTRYLINEIVIGEESDVDEFGNRTSHFELYLKAMTQCGADTTQIENFLNHLKENETIESALNAINAPKGVRDFVSFTFEIINTQNPALLAAVFTFGREDLIPDMFHAIINDINQDNGEKISTFKYYLDRHIEVDGDHHSKLAIQMVANLCKDDAALWNEAIEAAKKSLEMRAKLWDGVLEVILLKNTELVS